MIGRAKIEHGKDAGSPDIGNIGATEDTARRRFAAARAHETFETERYRRARGAAGHQASGRSPEGRESAPKRTASGPTTTSMMSTTISPMRV